MQARFILQCGDCLLGGDKCFSVGGPEAVTQRASVRGCINSNKPQTRIGLNELWSQALEDSDHLQTIGVAKAQASAGHAVCRETRVDLGFQQDLEGAHLEMIGLEYGTATLFVRRKNWGKPTCPSRRV